MVNNAEFILKKLKSLNLKETRNLIDTNIKHYFGIDLLSNPQKFYIIS